MMKYIYIYVYFLVIYLFEAELANLDKKVVDWHGELWSGVFGSGSRAKGWEALVTRYGARNVGVLTKLPFVTIMDACIGTHCGHDWSREGAKKFQLPTTSLATFFFLDSSFKIVVEDHLWIVARARTRARTNLYSNVRNHVATNWFFRCTRISGYGWQACQVQTSQSPFSKMGWRWHWNHQRVFERIWFVHIYASPTRSWTTAISPKSGKGYYLQLVFSMLSSKSAANSDLWVGIFGMISQMVIWVYVKSKCGCSSMNMNKSLTRYNNKILRLSITTSASLQLYKCPNPFDDPVLFCSIWILWCTQDGYHP